MSDPADQAARTWPLGLGQLDLRPNLYDLVVFILIAGAFVALAHGLREMGAPSWLQPWRQRAARGLRPIRSPPHGLLERSNSAATLGLIDFAAAISAAAAWVSLFFNSTTPLPYSAR